jgi:hypothetical protein
MTKEEAEKKVKEANDIGIEQYCPLIKQGCRNDWISFIPPSLHQYKGDYSVISPYCSCNLFREQLDVYSVIAQ